MVDLHEDMKSDTSCHADEPETNSLPSFPLETYSPISLHSAPSFPHLPPTSPFSAKTCWTSNFQIPWEKMPERLTEAIARGALAQGEDRRKMVRIVVDAMRVHCLNPNLAACTEVARQIVAQFPATFADQTSDEEQPGCGYYSILKQLKTRVEYVNRQNGTCRIRQPKKRPDDENSGGDTAVKQGRSELDRYGCINWQPTALPEGETPASLEAKRQTMSTVFKSAGPQAIEVQDMNEYMRLTYINQRQMINSWPAPSLCKIEEEWPFLFTKRGLCTHFRLLTGVDIDARLSEALPTKGRGIWNFFQSQRLKQTEEIQCLLRRYDSSGLTDQQVAVPALLLLMKYLHEKEDSIFILAEVKKKHI